MYSFLKMVAEYNSKKKKKKIQIPLCIWASADPLCWVDARELFITAASRRRLTDPLEEISMAAALSRALKLPGKMRFTLSTSHITRRNSLADSLLTHYQSE